MALARGWAVAITDYQGLGTPGDHTYMVGRALGPNVLDAMRAARTLVPSELPDDGPAAIIGYSEGGAAAAWAAQLQPSVRARCGARGRRRRRSGGERRDCRTEPRRTFFSFFIAYGGIGYAAAYPELDLDSYLTPRARKPDSVAARVHDPAGALRGPRFIRAADLTDPNVLELPEWRRRLRENRLGRSRPSAPVLLHHARRDQIVSFSQSARPARRLAGARCRRTAVRDPRWHGPHQRRGRGHASRARLDGPSARPRGGAPAVRRVGDRALDGEGRLTHIHARIADGVMLLELDRPPANAMDVVLLGELCDAIDGLASDPPGAVVLAGRSGFFSGGVDLKAVPGYGPASQRAMVQRINRMVIGAYALPCPVVAAVTGHAVAGGLVLALGADVRIGSAVGRYGLTEVRVAVPFPQAALMLVRAELTAGAARQLVLGAELLGADECLALGVFDEVVTPDDVVARATVRAQELAALPADVYARTKRDLRAGALAEMRAAAAHDPLLDAWTDATAFD